MNYKVKFFRIAVRFLGATRIDLYELVDLFRGLGYTIIAQLPPKGFKVSVGGSGPVAIKGNVTIDVNTDRLIVGVSSPKPEECINEFAIMEKAVTSRFNSLKKPYFYELLTELEIESNGVEPMKFLQRLSRENVIVKKLSSALGEPLFIFGYRLAKENSSPEDTEWVDIEIIPYLIRPHSSIYVSIVYRSSERERVLEKGKKLNAIIDAISDLMKGVEVSGR